MQRWHTLGPADEDITVRDKEPVIRSLPDLLRQSNAASNVPLYKILTETDLKTTFEATDDEVKWLKDSVKPAFDHYVGNVLRINRYEPWNDERQIRAEYAKEDAWRLPLYTVMARMLTYAEIEEQIVRATKVEGDRCASRSLWKPPSPRKRSAMNEHWKRRFLTDADTHQIWSIEPEELRGSRLDPRHRWGVVATSWPLENSPWSHPIRMACCGEYLGQSDGCWIMLDKGAQTYGEILEYTAFLGLVDWSAVVVDDGKLITWKTAPFQRGTAWQDLDYYTKLDEQIQTVITGLKTNMPTAFTAYIDKLQKTVDAAADESTPLTLDLDAYSTMITRAPQLTQLVTLLNAFNAIQLRTPVLDPREYVNRRIIKTHEMPTYWTYQARAGLQLTETGKKLRALKGNPLATAKDAQEFAQLIIDEFGQFPNNANFIAKYRNLDAVGQMVTTGLLPISRYYEKDDMEERFLLMALAREKMTKHTLKKTDVAIVSVNKNTYDEIIPNAIWIVHDTARKAALEVQTSTNNAIKVIKKNDTNAILPSMIVVDPPLNPPPPLDILKTLNEDIDARVLVNNVSNDVTLDGDFPGVYGYTIGSLAKEYDINKEADYDLVKSAGPVADAIRIWNVAQSTYAQNRAKFVSAIKQFNGRRRMLENSTTPGSTLRKRAVDKFEADILTANELMQQANKQGEDTLEKAFNTAKAVIAQASQDYDDDQKRKIAAATIAVQTIVIPDAPQATPPNLDKIAASLAAQRVALLALLTPFEQIGLAKDTISRITGDITNRIAFPTKEELERSRIEAGKDIGAFATAWNTNVVSAANALKKSLEDLLKLLGTAGIDVKKPSGPVSVALVAASTAAGKVIAEAQKVRTNYVESEAERLAREAKQKTEDDNVATLKSKLKAVYDWARTKGAYGDASYGNATNGNLYTNLLSNATIKQNIAGLDKGYVQLVQDQWNKGRIDTLGTVQPAQGTYNGLYVDPSIVTDGDIHTIVASILNAYVHNSHRDAKKYVEASAKLVRAIKLGRQPTTVKWGRDQTKKITVAVNTTPVPLPRKDGHSIGPRTQLWEGNSCWLDSAMLSIFTTHGLSFVEKLLSTTTVPDRTIDIEFDDGTTAKEKSSYERQCVTSIANMHKSLCADILDIQSSSPDEDKIVRRRAFTYDKLITFSQQNCGVFPIDNRGPEDPKQFFDALAIVYDLSIMGMRVGFETQTRIDDSGVITFPVDPQTNVYVVSVDVTNRWKAGETAIPYEQYTLPNDGNVFLAAAISGAESHYEVQVKDFKTGEICSFDPAAHQNPSDISDGARSLAWKERTFTRTGFKTLRPLRYLIYFSKVEVDRIKSHTPKAQPAPVPVPVPAAGSGPGSAAPAPQPQPGLAMRWTPIKVAELAARLTKPGIGGAPLNPNLQKIADWIGLKQNITEWSKLDGARNTIYVGHLDNPRLDALQRAYDAADSLSKVDTTAVDYTQQKNMYEEVIAQNMMRADINYYGSVEKITDQYAIEMNNLKIKSLPANEPDYKLVKGLLNFIATSGSSFNPVDTLIREEETARVAMRVDLENYK